MNNLTQGGFSKVMTNTPNADAKFAASTAELAASSIVHNKDPFIESVVMSLLSQAHLQHTINMALELSGVDVTKTRSIEEDRKELLKIIAEKNRQEEQWRS